MREGQGQLKPLEQLHHRWQAALDLAEPLDEKSKMLYEAEAGLIPSGELPLRLQRWLANAHALTEYVDRHDRWPHAKARSAGARDRGEERIANWIRYQRRHEVALCQYQRERLEVIPGFSWAPLDEQWDANLAGWAMFVAKTGRSPDLASENQTERTLAAWASHQRRLHRTHRLPARRFTELNQMGGWWWTR